MVVEGPAALQAPLKFPQCLPRETVAPALLDLQIAHSIWAVLFKYPLLNSILNSSFITLSRPLSVDLWTFC